MMLQQENLKSCLLRSIQLRRMIRDDFGATRMKNLRIRVANDRSHIKMSWEEKKQWIEVKIPINEYYESRLRE